MSANLAVENEKFEAGTPVSGSIAEPRWNLAFVGILLFLINEYARVQQMYPILRPFHVAKVVAGICVLGYIIGKRLSIKDSDARRIDLALVLYLIVCSVSGLFAENSGAAWSPVTDALSWGLVYFLISRIVSTTWRLRLFVLLLLLLCFKLAQFAIRSYFLYGDVTGSGGSLAMVGLGANDVFGNSNDFGHGMAVVWPIAGTLAWGEKKLLWRIILGAAFAAISLALLLSGCRGALLGIGVTVLVAIVRSSRKFWAVTMGLMIAIGAFLILPTANLDRLHSALHYKQDPEAQRRLALWLAGWQMFKDHPMLGVGPGNFAISYQTKYYGSDPNPAAWAPHNIYIQVLSEEGLLGMAAALPLWLFALGLNGRTRKRLVAAEGSAKQGFEYTLALGLELALVSYLVSAAFLTTFNFPHFWFLLGLSVGLNVACSRTVQQEGARLQVADSDSVMATK